MPSSALFTIDLNDLGLIGTWAFDPFGDTEDLGGTIELWEEPEPEGVYVIGADFALGLEGRDDDAGTVLRCDVTPVRQVCELCGTWGPSFDRILFATACFYNEAFILGERQVGLNVLRSILDALGYGHLYYDRSEEARSRKISDKLGYWRGEHDICIPNLRRALRAHKILIRSRPTLEQLRKLQYAPRRTSIEPIDALDRDLGIKLAGGGSPDRVMGLSYAWHAVAEAPKFEKPTPRFRKGSLGDILGHELLYRDPKREAGTWRQRREKRRR